MIFNDILKDGDIVLKCIELDDCTEQYANWLNDKSVNKFLECRFSCHSVESLKEFVNFIRQSNDNYMFSIFYKGDHVGNIKIGPINNIYNYAYIGYLIGEADLWGLGIAGKSVKLATAFAFNNLKLHKLKAGCFEENIASCHVLEKNGYKLEAVFKNELLVNKSDKYQDRLVYGIINKEVCLLNE